MASSRDPEVERLTQSIRELTGRARILSQGIDEAVAELETFRDGVATLSIVMPDRRSSPPGRHSGRERRHR